MTSDVPTERAAIRVSHGRRTMVRLEPDGPRRRVGSLFLVGNGAEWHGTFGVILRALLADVLPEGPVAATVYAESSAGSIIEISGEAARVDGDTLLFADGYAADLDTVRAFYI